MKIVFLGTGVAIPDGRAQSGILVETDIRILVDCGHGILYRLREYGVSPEDVDLVLITHSHTDHMGDLIALLKARWLIGADKLTVVSPQSVRGTLYKLLEAYSYLKSKLKFEFANVPFKINGIEIDYTNAVHSVESWAYRIESEEGSVTISGDTYPTRNIFELCKDGILIHELSFPSGINIENHSTPEKLIPFFEEYKLEKIIFTHMYPEAREKREEILKEFSGYTVGFAEDLMELEVYIWSLLMQTYMYRTP